MFRHFRCSDFVEIAMIGKTLGHYQISSQLGKGGIGEVHQAKNQKPAAKITAVGQLS